jgi:hypothetical protein
MKQLSAALVALAFLAVAAPAMAQYHDDHNRDNRGYEHGRPAYHHMAPPPRRRMVYHENQVWNGHHMHYHGGQWGYYQPRNGVNVFVNIPL